MLSTSQNNNSCNSCLPKQDQSTLVQGRETWLAWWDTVLATKLRAPMANTVTP